ncbi:MAG: hypothetical protein WC833_11080 [Bacteroidales bacterium]|jgi:hypothetical protein
MKKQTKKIIFWTVVAIAVLIVVIVVKNWDAFMNGYSTGGNMRE